MVPNGLTLLVFTEEEVLGVTLNLSYDKTSNANIIYSKYLFDFTPFDIRMLKNETILVGKKDNKYDYMFINNNPFYVNEIYEFKTIPDNDSQIILKNENRIQLLDANTFMLLKSIYISEGITSNIYVTENKIYFINKNNEIRIIDTNEMNLIDQKYTLNITLGYSVNIESVLEKTHGIVLSDL